jgi:hypothetical protein
MTRGCAHRAVHVRHDERGATRGTHDLQQGGSSSSSGK